MRQWFKLEQAYEMMEAYEQEQNRDFDLVLKLRTVQEKLTVLIIPGSGLRTDMFLPAPLDLADFPEILTSRTVYSFTDIAFMSRRDVARSLLKSVTEKLSQYAGNQRALFPLDFERLLRNGWVEGFRLQTFPDIGSPELRAAIASGHPNKCMALLRHYRRELENAGDVPSFSGHWRFRPETPEYQAWERDGKLAPDTQMCSVTRWFYLIHRTLPEVQVRRWPNHGGGMMGLFPERFTWHCNCEPPGCWPLAWGQAPLELIRGVDWIQHPDTGAWIALGSTDANASKD